MKAFITGVSGQDGQLLALYLLEQGYEVHGLLRPGRRTCVDPRVIFHYGDVTDHACMLRHLATIRPEHIYNLAAQTHVKYSEVTAFHTWTINTSAIFIILQACLELNLRETRIYQAGSSEEYGPSPLPLTETSERHPVSVYGLSKLAAREICDYYRRVHAMFVVSGTLFNHESSRRGAGFVTQKIARYVAEWDVTSDPLVLGNIDSVRDWGYAGDYVRSMHAMLTQDTPETYVIATGDVMSVREFCVRAFAIQGRTVVWNEHAQCCDATSGRVLIITHPTLHRECDIPYLEGDARKAKERLGWVPETKFDDVIREMMQETQFQYFTPESCTCSLTLSSA